MSRDEIQTEPVEKYLDAEGLVHYQVGLDTGNGTHLLHRRIGHDRPYVLAFTAHLPNQIQGFHRAIAHRRSRQWCFGSKARARAKSGAIALR
jgi:hypothetical protein